MRIFFLGICYRTITSTPRGKFTFAAFTWSISESADQFQAARRACPIWVYESLELFDVVFESKQKRSAQCAPNGLNDEKNGGKSLSKLIKQRRETFFPLCKINFPFFIACLTPLIVHRAIDNDKFKFNQAFEMFPPRKKTFLHAPLHKVFDNARKFPRRVSFSPAMRVIQLTNSASARGIATFARVFKGIRKV